MVVFQLSNKDRQILYELSLNARLSLTELGKKVKMSKQSVRYRISFLEKNKIIIGYYVITNIYLLGMTHYRVFIKYQNICAEKEAELLNYLKNNTKITWIANFDGEMDLAFLVWARDIIEFEKVYDEINELYGVYFQEKYFSIATRIEYLKYNFLFDKSSEKNQKYSQFVLGGGFSNEKTDELDKKILKELSLNGRMTLVEIANKHGSSAKVIRERIEKMRKKGIILGFNVKIDHRKIGYTHRKVLLKLSQSTKEDVMKLTEFLRRQKNTIFIVKPIGEYDLEFELMSKSNEEFHEIINILRREFASVIKSYDAVIHYSEPKSGQLYEL